MPNCVKCHQPQTAAPAICRSCYRALTERTVSVDDKLIEALRCCGNRDCKKPDCDHCPLLKTHMCVKVMLESAATALEDRGAVITENAALHRTAEDDKAREEGRLVVLPCKVGDDVFTMRWSIKNEKYEVFAGKVKNVRYDAIDGSVMVSDGEYYREWGKNAFSSRQAAAAALGGGEGG